MRVGLGYDVHPLVAGRKLIIGGIEITYDKGLDGHSDADVLTHAIMDALLGASALGNIGTHFPPENPKYEDISSLTLLRDVNTMLQSHGWKINNIDSTIIAQAPPLSSYIDRMREVLSQTLNITREQLSIKATTTEGLGSIGRGEGIAVQSIALIEQLKENE